MNSVPCAATLKTESSFLCFRFH